MEPELLDARKLNNHLILKEFSDLQIRKKFSRNCEMEMENIGSHHHHHGGSGAVVNGQGDSANLSDKNSLFTTSADDISQSMLLHFGFRELIIVDMWKTKSPSSKLFKPQS